MPRLPPHPCAEPGCPALVDGQPRCEAHKAESWKRYDESRGSRDARGYGSRWRKVREIVLNAEPLCRLCAKAGIVTAATLVDHIVPKAREAEDYRLENLQPLCRACHNRKTREESAGRA